MTRLPRGPLAAPLAALLVAAAAVPVAAHVLPEQCPGVVAAELPAAPAAPSAPGSARRRVPTDGAPRTDRSTGTSSVGTPVESAPGVLMVDGTLPQGRSAGTAMTLSADGYALTNYHVVAGTTALTATDDSGHEFTAHVVGADETHDVALLRLDGASDLPTVRLDLTAPTLGTAVTAVGDGGGQDRLVQVTGTVRQLDDDIQVRDESTGGAHALDGLIRTDAPVVPGYSGGPLFDGDGEVVGINTAASSDASEGFAIPIARAVEIADLIKEGKSNDTVRVGPRPALGVTVSGVGRGACGAGVVGVAEGSGAERAGLTEGSVITLVGGVPVTDVTQLQAAVATHRVGDEVRLTWTDADGARHEGTVTLGASPVN